MANMEEHFVLRSEDETPLSTTQRGTEEQRKESNQDEMDDGQPTEKEEKNFAGTSTQVTRKRAMKDNVSEFIVRTCQMLPKSNTDVFESMRLQGFKLSEWYGYFCGSSVEFFIRPLHSCIDDIDNLKISSLSLAFTDEKPVLPYDVRHIPDTIDCYFIKPYPDYPAFVRLRLLGEMSYNWKRKTFEYMKANVQTWLGTNLTEEGNKLVNDGGLLEVGPAWKFRQIDSLSLDHVNCIWCPQWPNEAKDWPIRRRKYGWPTIAHIHEIVQNGCHVVSAKHPACRNDMLQRRLSFSVAEVILLQSWTQVQQIVYHMLRFFAKIELIKKDCPKEDEVLCTYHFKTLMLWSCEEMSSEWWNSLSVIEICCNLLKELAKWLKESRCQNYFIPHANLFHEHFKGKIVDETTRTLIIFGNFHALYHWFEKYYIQPISPHTTDTIMILRHVNEYMEGNACTLKSIDAYISIRFFWEVEYAHETVQRRSQNPVRETFKHLLRTGSLSSDELDVLPRAEIESCYWLYGSMLRILHAAQLLSWKEMHYDSAWFVEEITQVSYKPKFVRSNHSNLPRTLNTGANKSLLYFLKAQGLMENLTGSRNDVEFQIASEISKGLIRRTLECEDSKTRTIAKATLAYMAALQFASSEYQIVIDLCSRVIMDEKPDTEDTEPINAGCLLYIEDIPEIIGFYLIFRKTKDASLHYIRRQFFLDLRLTPEVFAQYLSISSIERTVMAFQPKNISQTPKFPLDVILMTITNHRCSQILKKGSMVLHAYERINPIHKLAQPNEICLPSDNDIIQLLLKFSLELITSFYNAICKDFDIHCSTADCYRAAYLYKCRQYPAVMHLYERILNEPDFQSDLKEFAFANVMVVPPIDSFFDRDIQCLLGLHTLVCYLSPSNEDLSETKVTEMSTFQHHFAREIYLGKSLLSAFLTETYCLKCHYFLGRHFLARYLKVRCLINSNHLLSEVLLEFKKLKACLPFEHIIRCFLEQKLRQLQKGVDAVHRTR